MISPSSIKISEWDDLANHCLVIDATLNVGRRYRVARQEIARRFDIRADLVERLRREIWRELYGEIERRLSGLVPAGLAGLDDTEKAVLGVLKMVRYPQEPVDSVAVERSPERIEHTELMQ